MLKQRRKRIRNERREINNGERFERKMLIILEKKPREAGSATSQRPSSDGGSFALPASNCYFSSCNLKLVGAQLRKNNYYSSLSSQTRY